MNQENRDDEQQNGEPPQNQNGQFNNFRRWFWIIIPLLLLLPFLTTLFTDNQSATISYTEFRQQIQQGNVTRVTIAGNRVEGSFKQGVSGSDSGIMSSGSTFVTYVPDFGDQDIMQLLRENNVTIYTEPARENISFWGVLFNLLPFILLLWIGYSVYRSMRQQGRGIFSVGQNKAKLYDKATKVQTKFDDVAGLVSAKEEVTELVDFLKNPERYEKLGAKTPKGVLLVGPPGTGKTLIARAIAGEADAPFFSMSGSDFMEMFVGVGASRVRNLFKDAKRRQPSIIFIDELDSIGRHRGAGLGGGHDEREQTLNQLLAELDGFESTESVIVLAATNRPDILDPALLRPGRFDRRVTTILPSVKDREEILGIHTQNRPLGEDVSLGDVAKSTPGFAGADLENLVNEASLLAARKHKEAINMDDIEEARDKVLMGLERKNMTLSEEERKVVAFHESGHAISAALLPNTDPVLKVTIIPRERSMGVTQQLPEEERYLYNREYLLDRICVILGGRAAEDIVFNTLTNGAENDLQQATRLAKKMVTDWGMSERFGPFHVGGERKDVFLGEDLSRQREYSETTAREIDEEVSRILNEAYDRTKRTIEQNRKLLDSLAEQLLEKEELDAKEVMEILGLSTDGAFQSKTDAAKRAAVAQKRGSDQASGDQSDQPEADRHTGHSDQDSNHSEDSEDNE